MKMYASKIEQVFRDPRYSFYPKVRDRTQGAKRDGTGIATFHGLLVRGWRLAAVVVVVAFLGGALHNAGPFVSLCFDVYVSYKGVIIVG
jgi:hypothetical protein